jgi:uncharacterized RDD family membrane protein YckC
MTSIGTSDAPLHSSPLDRHGRPPVAVVRRAVARLTDFAVGIATFFGLILVFQMSPGSPVDGTGAFLVASSVTFILYLLYEVGCVAVWGQTLGKWLTGLAVVRHSDGGKPGLVRAFLRNLVPTALLIGFFPLYPLPYVLAAVVGDHRWPHDRLAGTAVVRIAQTPRCDADGSRLASL